MSEAGQIGERKRAAMQMHAAQLRAPVQGREHLERDEVRLNRLGIPNGRVF